MDKAELLALAERVEKLTGPDREADQDVFCALGLAPFIEGAFDAYRAPAYTASLDAAMTLVPEGCAWTLYSDGPTYMASAEIGIHPVGGELMQAQWSGEGNTPALALCAAALRARASITRTTGDGDGNNG